MKTALAAACAARAVLESWDAIRTGSVSPHRAAGTAMWLESARRSAFDSLLLHPPDEIAAMVQHNPALQDVAIAQYLIEEVDHRYDRVPPAQLLPIATAAIMILQKDGRDVFATLLVRALLDRATLLRHLGRFAEAHETIERARSSALRTSALHLHAASIAVVRASILTEQDRTEQATDLLRSAREAFIVAGDEGRAERADLSRFLALYRTGDFEAAREIVALALAAAQERGDDYLVALHHGNVAVCCVRLNEFDEARLHFAMAAKGYETLGLVIPRARAQWSMARMAVRTRGIRASGEMMRARRVFEEMGMPGESIRVDLSLVEEWLAVDPGADVAKLCGDIVKRAFAIGMDGAAIIALTKLRDTAEQQNVTPETVRQVLGCINPSFMEADRTSVMPN